MHEHDLRSGGIECRVELAARTVARQVPEASAIDVRDPDIRRRGGVHEDDLAAVVRAFGPGPGARLGVLVDHLVPGSKEARLAAVVAEAHVLVTGTPFVDVWQAVKPAVVGIPAWPVVPRGEDWKTGVCTRLGVDPNAMWPRILASVRSYADLEPALVGAVERLIDFVTEPPAPPSG